MPLMPFLFSLRRRHYFIDIFIIISPFDIFIFTLSYTPFYSPLSCPFCHELFRHFHCRSILMLLITMLTLCRLSRVRARRHGSGSAARPAQQARRQVARAFIDILRHAIIIIFITSALSVKRRHRYAAASPSFHSTKAAACVFHFVIAALIR